MEILLKILIKKPIKTEKSFNKARKYSFDVKSQYFILLDYFVIQKDKKI